MGKFIITNLGIRRKPTKPIKDERVGITIRMEEEELEVIISYIGFGDTTKITTEELMDKLREKLGDEL